LVEKTTRLFGDPIATVRDMGTGGAKAVAPLREKGIPDLICHLRLGHLTGRPEFPGRPALAREGVRSETVR
jgi:hypothetical protein